MTITSAELFAIPDSPEDVERNLPADELRVLARVVLDEPGREPVGDEEAEMIALRQAQWMASHVIQGWISGWTPRWRALAIELVEDSLALSARRRVLRELADLKREVDGREDPVLEELFARRVLRLTTFFARRGLFG